MVTPAFLYVLGLLLVVGTIVAVTRVDKTVMRAWSGMWCAGYKDSNKKRDCRGRVDGVTWFVCCVAILAALVYAYRAM
jgi:uncharacterized membrane protein YecN with MAPEG domain